MFRALILILLVAQLYPAIADERSDAHNLLLKTAEVTGVIFTITGLWLLLYSFSGRRNKKAPGQ